MKTGVTFCQCLYEIENSLPRKKFCFVPCRAQFKILAEREKAKQERENKKDSE